MNVQQTPQKPAVLIVDDQPASIHALANLLRDDYRILAAPNGQKALEQVSGPVIPHLILLDIMMPDIDGYEVCRRLKADAKTSDIPVIFVTAMDQDRDEEYGLSLGAVDYITKPYKPAIVQARVSNQVDLKLHTDMLEQSVQERRILLDNIQTQIWYLTSEHTYGAVNKAHADFCGMNSTDMAYKDMYEIFTSDIVEVCRRSNVEVFSRGRAVITEEWVPDASGRQRLLSITKTPRIGADGSVEYVVCSAEDITRRKQIEEEIRQTRDQFKTLVSNIPGVTFRCKADQHWTMLYMSDAVNFLTGYPAGDFINNAVRSYESVIHEDDRSFVDQSINTAISEGRHWDIEYRICHRDGDIRWVHEKGRAVSDKTSGVVYLDGFILDITERKADEKIIRQTNEQLEMVIAEKDKLFSIIAHDLKSPMCGLISSTDMLSSQLDTFTQEDIRFISTELHKNAKSTFALLEELLQWAQMNQGGIEYTPEPCAINELVNIGINTVNKIAADKNIHIRKHFSGDLVVLADQSMIKTVIRNILVNALKFSHRNSEIVIRAWGSEENITVAIEDNGIGMSKEVSSLLFKIDKAKQQFGTDGEKGTGLGLILCKQFIEQHGEKLWVESAPGKGTTVFFTLPQYTENYPGLAPDVKPEFPGQTTQMRPGSS